MGELKKVLGYLRELRFKPDVDKFQDRLVIQKTVCLLEMMGLDIGYHFSLYVRGPYSPSLTNDLYSNRNEVNNLKTNYSPDDEEKKKLSTFSEISNNLEPTLLEIMSTYAFLIREPENDEKQALVKLKKLKSFYSEGRIAMGVSKAKQLLFKPSEKDIEKMKSEFSDWQDASIADQN
jgi:uncharacterized protein YwgA